jgi:uncharacterized membrane protein YqaE (UPF0057 family)
MYIGVIVGILIAIWINGDSKKRGMNPILWTILGFLFGLIGAVIYLIARKPIVQETVDTDSFGKPEKDENNEKWV